MSKNSEHHDTYIIPPNFIEGSTLFGGMFKIRNVIEAGVLAAAVGVPVFSLDLSLTTRIIILCLTALPLALFALMGVAGEPLSSYIVAFFKWLKNRRVVGKTEPKEVRKKPKPKKGKRPSSENESMLSEIAGVIRKRSAKKKHTEKPRAAKTPKREKPHRRSKADSPFLNPAAEYLPIEKIANGIIYTKDHRYIKLIEVVPINFLLRSAREQRSIIRGRKLLQVDKCDYTKHPESKKMISCKASAHIPEWQKKQPKEVEEVSPAPVKKPGRKKRAPASNVVPTDKDSIMSKN